MTESGRNDQSLSVKQRNETLSLFFQTYTICFPLFIFTPGSFPLCNALLSIYHSMKLCGPFLGMRGLRWMIESDWGWGSGCCPNFHINLSAYVKMLSLSPSQVLPLQRLKFAMVGGWEGFEGGCLERFPFLNICHMVT